MATIHPEKSSKSVLSVLAPGFLQGMTRAAISHPWDVVKVNAQTTNKPPFQVAASIVKTQPSLLFRGLPFSVGGVATERALSFGLFETILAKNKESSPFLCAFAAAVPCSLVSVPILSITSNLVTGQNQHGGIAAYFRTRMADHGPGFFFRAYPQEVLRSVIGGTIYMGAYKASRDRLPDSRWGTCGAAIAAGWSVWGVQYPWDTIRTLFQTSNRKDASLLDTARRRIKTEGTFSLFRGLPVVLFRTSISSVVGMIVYEEAKRWF